MADRLNTSHETVPAEALRDALLDAGTPAFFPAHPTALPAVSVHTALGIVDRLVELRPIDMVLHCPACGMQHIDAPESPPKTRPGDSTGAMAAAWFGTEAAGAVSRVFDRWDNPPHRSHKCHGCGHIWRPADVATNGVAGIKTKGKADSPIAAPSARAGVDRDAARYRYILEHCRHVTRAHAEPNGWALAFYYSGYDWATRNDAPSIEIVNAEVDKAMAEGRR
jgi:hypothetical protein